MNTSTGVATRHSPAPEPTAPRHQAIAWLYTFLLPHRRSLLLLGGLSLLATALVVIQPYLTKLIIDQGLLAKNFPALLAYTGWLLAAGIAATLLSGFNRIQHTSLSGKILFAIREDVYGHLQKLPVAFLHQQRSGDLISRLDKDIAEIQRFAVDTLFSTLSSLLSLVGAVAIMVYLEWRLALVLLLLLPIEFFYLYKMRPKVERANRSMREKGADISAFLAEKIPNIKFIQTAGTEAREVQGLRGLNSVFLGKLLQLQKLEFWTAAIPITLVSLSRAAVFLVGGYWVVAGSFEVGSLVAFAAYVGMAIGPVQSLLGLYLAWQRLTVSLDRVRYLRQQPLPQPTIPNQPLPDRLAGELAFKRVSFSYDGQRNVINALDLTIKAGRKLAITGGSGEGKTTLLDLIQSHLKPDTGLITIDGYDINSVDSRQWRSRIAVVPQQPVIFRDSFYNNICYGNPTATQAEVEAVIQAVGLDKLAQKLPQGLQTAISEYGASLSGGECQRISLARALLQKPVLLLLDEPTSATEEPLQLEISAQIDRLFPNTTRIVVSHQAAPLHRAEKVVELKNGTVRASDA